MSCLACIAVALLLLASPDVPRAYLVRPEPAPVAQIPPGATLPVLPELPRADAGQDAGKKPATGARLRPESRIEIVRYVSGEFARVVRPLPASRKGFRFKVGEPLDETAMRRALQSSGSAGNPGDTVQVTRIEFREKEIAVDINGGGKPKRRWRDRVQVQVGGVPTVTTTTSQPQGLQPVGSTLILEFGRALPDMSADDLKGHLAVFLDFSKQRSAAVHWVETLPPEFQQAIKERRAIVGMDREMVLAAMGRPDQKIRERNDEGVETEDWVYGHPPGKTVFVKFAGDKVISVRQYP